MIGLFVKNKYSYGGPWSSFDYDQVTPQWILENTFSKAGHPFPMICLCKMDCKIIEEDMGNTLWESQLYGQNDSAKPAIENLVTNTCAWEDIDFSKYDYVYTEDPIVPAPIIENNPNIKFIYNLIEHWNPICPPHKKYIFFDHTKNSFPYSKKDVSKFINRKESRIHVEYRTSTDETYLKELSEHCKMDLVYKTNTSLYMIESDLPENGLGYWNRLGRSKYNVQLPVEGHSRCGQGFGDAASIDCVNIGLASFQHNNSFIHPENRVDNITDTVSIIQKLESDINKYNQVLQWQNEAIEASNKKFNELLKK